MKKCTFVVCRKYNMYFFKFLSNVICGINFSVYFYLLVTLGHLIS